MNQLANLIWSVADLLRGDFPKAMKQVMIESMGAYQKHAMLFLSDPEIAGFTR